MEGREPILSAALAHVRLSFFKSVLAHRLRAFGLVVLLPLLLVNHLGPLPRVLAVLPLMVLSLSLVRLLSLGPAATALLVVRVAWRFLPVFLHIFAIGALVILFLMRVVLLSLAFACFSAFFLLELFVEAVLVALGAILPAVLSVTSTLLRLWLTLRILRSFIELIAVVAALALTVLVVAVMLATIHKGTTVVVLA